MGKRSVETFYRGRKTNGQCAYTKKYSTSLIIRKMQIKGNISHLLEWLFAKGSEISGGKDESKGNPCALFVGV